jgi:DNA-binding LytR/AlgR family response regulator
MNGKGVLIVEDEFIIAQNLRQILQDLGYKVSGHAFDVTEAMAILQEGDTALALLDIRLGKGPDGIDLAQAIRQDYGIPFIFITSFSDKGTIERAKAVHPAGFLVKPFNREEIYATIEIALANRPERQGQPLEPGPRDHMFVKVGATLRKVQFSEVTLLKADRVYVEIHRKDGPPLLVRESLNAWEEKLPSGFLRVNRSYIIHLAHVTAVETGSVTVAGVEIAVTRQVREEIEQKIREL